MKIVINNKTLCVANLCIRDNIKEDNKILQWWFDLRGAPFGSDRGSIPQGSLLSEISCLILARIGQIKGVKKLEYIYCQ